MNKLVVETQQQIDAANWLPITSSRNAKWWYSAFHNVTAVVGAGILGLPYAMSQIGWVPGLTVITLSWLITFYSFWQLVELHEIVPGKRFDRYPELGQHCFGPKLGYWIVMPQQLTVQVASSIVYTVTGGKSLKKFFELLFPAWGHVRTTYYILFFTCCQFVISQSPNFNSLKGVSLLAAIMSLGYSLIAFVASTIQGSKHHEQVSFGVRSSTRTGQIFDVLNGCGTIAFAFAGHSVALEIQATIPSTPEKPSKIAMWKGVVVAYILVALCYVSVSRLTLWCLFHVIGSYQVFTMPVLYVAVVGFVAMCIPFFGGLLGLFGGLVFSSTSFYMPCIMWLVTQNQKHLAFTGLLHGYPSFLASCWQFFHQ
ncbi:hypothetical protein M0R45_026999 [Rubus argutus]|uniref:Amino acid transporter transmembrane domain-containing protein n=1 Tax=Rubus argutus TaxID=59490 RepID=A0AAW1X0X4_RUBAR